MDVGNEAQRQSTSRPLLTTLSHLPLRGRRHWSVQRHPRAPPHSRLRHGSRPFCRFYRSPTPDWLEHSDKDVPDTTALADPSPHDFHSSVVASSLSASENVCATCFSGPRPTCCKKWSQIRATYSRTRFGATSSSWAGAPDGERTFEFAAPTASPIVAAVTCPSTLSSASCLSRRMVLPNSGVEYAGCPVSGARTSFCETAHWLTR